VRAVPIARRTHRDAGGAQITADRLPPNVYGRFDAPQRQFAAGTAYLRGMGRGRVRAVHGVEEAQQRFGHLVVEARLPQPGQPAGTDYLGEGYVIVRDPDTAVVADALHGLITGIRVELAESQ